MKTIQITIDEELLEQIDCQAEAAGIARSAWIRDVAQRELESLRNADFERRHREAYLKQPQTAEELAFLDANLPADEEDWTDWEIATGVRAKP